MRDGPCMAERMAVPWSHSPFYSLGLLACAMGRAARGGASEKMGEEGRGARGERRAEGGEAAERAFGRTEKREAPVDCS